MNVQTPPEKLTAKDFASDQEVRWCPGCGDYAILKGVQKTLADIGSTPENTVFISGIGCASRFPYYMETYGFHTIHGRAPAIATGAKLANPDLDIWLVSGDGDALSIGGNHTLHLLRRNVDIQFLLFNNEVYGLTKGQYSPTSRKGMRSPTTPTGSTDNPVSPCQFALGAGGRFIARTTDVSLKQMPGILARAKDHSGTSFVEILQNCIVYNDGVWDPLTDKATKEESQIHVEHGQPLLYGKDNDKGLRLKNDGSLALEAVTIGEDGVTEAEILVHDETNSTLAMLLSGMEPPHFPKAMGVLFCDPAPAHDDHILGLVADAQSEGKTANLNDTLRKGHTWTVE
jgi:2-oxoglutarate ferredoxin oxidoreductase subunit beta